MIFNIKTILITRNQNDDLIYHFISLEHQLLIFAHFSFIQFIYFSK